MRHIGKTQMHEIDHLDRLANTAIWFS